VCSSDLELLRLAMLGCRNIELYDDE
jgi:hypothetical protein